jgi:hypothetical protein
MSSWLVWSPSQPAGRAGEGGWAGRAVGRASSGAGWPPHCGIAGRGAGRAACGGVGSRLRRGLVRLADCVSECACTASVFYDPDDAGLRCWNCGQIPPRPPLLQLPGCTVALSHGATITSHHLSRDRDHDTIVAVAEEHPTRAGALVLRNVGKSAWTMMPAGETAKAVSPGRRLGVRPMLIDFGSVQGQICCETPVPRPGGS